MAFKIEFEMAQYRKTWSYIFYHDSADINTAKNAATREELLQALMKIHYPTCVLERVVVTEEDTGLVLPPPARNTDHVTLNRPGTSHPIVNVDLPSTNITPDVSQTAAYFEFKNQNPPITFAQHNFRGLPDSWTVREAFGGFASPTPAARNAFDALVNAIIASTLCIRVRRGPTLAPTLPVNVASLQGQDGDVNTLVTTYTPHGLEAGHTVSFMGIAKKAELLAYRNDHRVIAIPVVDGAPSTTQFLINARYRSKEAQLVVPNLRVRRVVYDYKPIVAGQFLKFAPRDTGTGRYESRGARRGDSYRT